MREVDKARRDARRAACYLGAAEQVPPAFSASTCLFDAVSTTPKRAMLLAAPSLLGAPELASAGGTPLLPAQATASSSTARPHIVMVLADDLGWNQVGYQSRDGRVSTPHIDALASVGIKLQRMYAHHICSPSRSALQSGRAPHQVNLENYDHLAYVPGGGGEWGYAGMPPRYEGLGSVMRRGGYKTHMLGKWHVGMSVPMQTPAGRGYDDALVHFSCAIDGWTFSPCFYKYSRKNDFDLWESGAGISPIHGRPASALLNDPNCNKGTAVGWSGAGPCVYSDEILARRMEAIIAAHPLSDAEHPMFLFLSPHSKHGPHDEPTVLKNCPAQSLGSTADAGEAIAAEAIAAITAEAAVTGKVTDCETQMAVASLDGFVGRVADALRSRAGLWDTSLLVFASDNGGAAPEEWANTPLRGGKRTVWEGGIRVVAFASGGFLPTGVRGTVQDGLMCLHDLYATFAALAKVTDLQGAPTSSMFPVTALDMSGLLLGSATESPRQTVIVGNTPCGGEQFIECEESAAGGGHSGVGVINAVIHRLHDDTTNTSTLLKLVVGGALMNNLHGGATACGREANDEGCLYDLNDDESEQTSLAAQRPEAFSQLLALADLASSTSPRSDPRGHGQHGFAGKVPRECTMGMYPRRERGWELLERGEPLLPFLDDPPELLAEESHAQPSVIAPVY